MTPSDLDCYPPEVIRHWLRGSNWRQLAEMAEGTGGGQGYSGGGGKGRLTFAIVRADLERAADQLPLYWQSTEYIFHVQSRSACLRQRRLTAGPVADDQREQEHPVPSAALEQAIYRMARTLGWQSEEVRAA